MCALFAGFEWSVLPALASSPSLLPSSISLELHFVTQMPELKWYGRLRTPTEIAAWGDYMFTRGGYMLVDRRDNVYCPHCTEIVIARLAHCGKSVARNSSGAVPGVTAFVPPSPSQSQSPDADRAALRLLCVGLAFAAGVLAARRCSSGGRGVGQVSGRHMVRR